jgi:hypothetical protein
LAEGHTWSYPTETVGEDAVKSKFASTFHAAWQSLVGHLTFAIRVYSESIECSHLMGADANDPVLRNSPMTQAA